MQTLGVSIFGIFFSMTDDILRLELDITTSMFLHTHVVTSWLCTESSLNQDTSVLDQSKSRQKQKLDE